MKKSLLFYLRFYIALSVSFLFVQSSHAQLFDLPSVLCTGMRLDLKSYGSGSTYYWNYCAGSLENTPATVASTTLTTNFPLHSNMIKDNKNFHLFYVNSASQELIRADFGTDLKSTPNEHNFGSLNGALPLQSTSISVIQDVNTGIWFAIITGISANNVGQICRVELGAAINNNNVTAINYGDNEMMTAPLDLDILYENNAYMGYIIDGSTNNLIRIDFGSSMYNIPSITSLGASFNLNFPKSIAFAEIGTNKYAFVTSTLPSGLTALDFGNSWTNTPTSIGLGDYGGLMSSPYDLAIFKDCGSINILVNNSISNNLVKLNYSGNIMGMTALNYGPVVGSTVPLAMSEIFRNFDGNDVLYFEGSPVETKSVDFPSCNIPQPFSISNVSDPDWIKYSTPGYYTIYHAVNEGLSNEQIECKTIQVIDAPPTTISNDTLICQGDEIELFANSTNALQYAWTPNYNISDSSKSIVNVWPAATTEYICFITFDNGCVVDKTVNVNVSHVTADAGPDQLVYDGSKVNIGGQYTSTNDTGTYFYQWMPANQVEDATIPFTFANPNASGNFILRVTNLYGCIATDTARITLNCDDINLPNAFSPTSGDASINTFKILNHGFVKLNKFMIFNRYGNLVFETTDINKGWDGIYKTVLQPQDNYVWHVEAICNNGYIVKRSGTVLLLR